VKDKNKQILKVLVGSHAHKLATPKSDFDYRGVFVTPTSELLKVGANIKSTHWIERKNDDISWEIGKFLMMATKCNPTILECLKAPIEDGTHLPYGTMLQDLFPHVWNSIGVKNAFIGYGLNQRKKFLEKKDNRAPKYAVAYLRTLYNAWELLRTGDFNIDMSKSSIYETLKQWKAGAFTTGKVIDITETWRENVELAFDKNQNKETNIDIINDYLLFIRKKYWETY